ncbi:amidohydrolase [bacterium]|nr:amidohydrolase [bacterium]
MSWDDPGPNGEPAASAPYEVGTDEKVGLWIPDAEALAIRNGIIVAVGSSEEIERLIGENTRVVQLNGATVLPGLVESHGHLHELGEKNAEVDLTGVVTESNIADRLAASLDVPAGTWILGRGWDEAAWANALPNKAFLNELFPNNPVVLRGMRGFGTLGNDAALAAAGLSVNTPDPVGGTLVRGATGELTGVLLNNATDLLNDAIPERTMQQKMAILDYGIDRMLESGYVSTHHAGVRTDYLPAYQTMASSGALRMRVEAMLSVGVVGAPDVAYWASQGPTADAEEMLQIRSVKAYYDGSLGSRGARMVEDYSDQAGQRGLAGEDYGFNEDEVATYMKAGFQVGIHAIGDAGNREVLDFYERTFAMNPEAQANRHRIEHAQVVHPDDFSRFHALGLIASMEPGHAVEDSPWAEDRVGPDRIKGAYAWRTMRQNGVPLLFNSDFTGTDWSFFYGVYAAVTRKKADGTPKGGWYPELAVTPEEAIRAYTVGPAFSSHRENLTGTLEVGKWADVTVLDIDPLNVGLIQPDSLLTGKVLMTIINGNVEYDAANQQ